jgi:hypothetical protein
MVGALAYSFRSPGHVLDAEQRWTDGGLLSGNSFGLSFGQTRRTGLRDRGGQVWVSVCARDDFGLMIKAAGRESQIASHNVERSDCSHTDREEEVSSIHFQF